MINSITTDKAISRVFTLFSVLILLYWLYSGGAWLWDWYFSSGGYSSDWWPIVGRFLLDNLSIVIALYAIACLQTAGLAELKFNNHFLKAFSLALILTPPIMMIIYGHRDHAK
ncbi:MAG: hypothetical protein HQ562_05205 [Candidatus Marinimicrobia bacterium]|nr:hypothetical protein [Candidatus Neomarinimicrobiota bacterium]